MKGLTYAEKESDPSKSQTSINLIYETQDGYITAGVVSDKEWVGLCKAFNRDDLITDERFTTSVARRQHIKERREVTSSEIAKWTTAEILERLDANDVPSAPLLTRIELLQHEQILASNTISREFIEGFGEVRQAMPAAKFQVTESSLRLPAPRLGEHSLTVLQSLGFGEAECENLINEKVVIQS
jgi:crotonobetainyl-CoA:carnitine CoA-transferase CaiB-like acyl-CoA transferase